MVICLALMGDRCHGADRCHLPLEELEACYRAARDATEARHVRAIWLLAQGRTFVEVAQVLAFVPRWVEELAARYNAFGPEALGDQRRRNGRAASLLTEAVLTALSERVRRPPEDGGLWSGPKVAVWMARHLGLARLHPQRSIAPRSTGGPEANRLVARGAAAAAATRGDARAACGLQGGLDAAVAQAKAAHPDRPIEVWAEDEHRLGLKPIRRRVWTPVGQRPIALGHHRCQRLHVVAFVQPTSGETVWCLATGLSKPFFEALLAAFARETGAGRRRSIVLALDNAGWHGPEGFGRPRRDQPRLPAALCARPPARRASLAAAG